MPQGHVTVIIPTYNRARLVARAVESVLGQSYPSCRALVIDDGSTDGTGEVLREAFGGNERVQYCRIPNGGVSRARNHGLRLAETAYVAFLDSDDVWLPWKVELQVGCIERLASERVGMIWSDHDAVDDSGAVVVARAMRHSYGAYRWFDDKELFEKSAPLAELLPHARDPGQRTMVRWGDAFHGMVMGNLCQPSTVLLTRERANQVGGFNEDMRSGEDHEYHLRCARAGPVAMLDIAAVAYRKSGGADQLTHRPYQLQIARNMLRTVEPVIRRERARIRLPDSWLRAKLAEAHAWIAAELLHHGDRSAALGEIARSLRYDPWRRKTWKLGAKAALPDRVAGAIRELRRGLKGG